MIDGRRVLDLQQGLHTGDDYFNRRIGPILRLASRASCPVQLILKNGISCAAPTSAEMRTISCAQ